MKTALSICKKNYPRQTTVYGYSLFTHCSFDTKKRSVIKRPTDSTAGTESGQTDTTSGQTSATCGQTSTTNGQTNGKMSSTGKNESTTSG